MLSTKLLARSALLQAVVVELFFSQLMVLGLTGGYCRKVLTIHDDLANISNNYWDPYIQPEKYSFVDFAISKGHSVFYYDRLGLSKSAV